MRYVSRYLGHDAICIAIFVSRFSAARGEIYVEITVNNVTVILVVLDARKISSTSTNTVPPTVPVSRARSSRRLSSKRYYKLPVVIPMFIRDKRRHVVMYNINAMKLN